MCREVVVDYRRTALQTGFERPSEPVLEALRLGFSPVFVPYDRPARPGRSRWTLRKKVRMAAATFFGSSSYPLRLITTSSPLFESTVLTLMNLTWPAFVETCFDCSETRLAVPP